MSSFNLSSTTSLARWYDEENGYENKRPYRAICSIAHLTPDTVFIYGMHGKLNKIDMVWLFQELQSLGVKFVMAERKKKLVTRDIDTLLSKA